nr:16S rRNA (cytosine(967)-C(5))-methyltransferase RsmB [Caldimonas tepidiphila]
MASPPSSLPLWQLLQHTADALAAVRAGRSLNEALAACPAAARPGTQALSFQVMRQLGRADALRRRLAKRAPPPAVDALLTTALALLWQPEAAPYAPHTLVDQAVDAVKRRERASASFVNAVLRRFLRERDALVAATEGDPVARFNHPRWWIERLRRDWPREAEALLAANNRQPPMTLRVNARRTSVERIAERFARAGIEAERVGPWGLKLAAPRPVTQIPGFAEGEVSVQDLAAQWAAPLLLEGAPLAPRARVLDACAAPGGKTAHLLELAELDLLALDSDPARLARVGDTLGRLGLAAELKAADAREPALWWDGRLFDAILMDAPCSASGIVRRHPDVRWLRRDSDIAQLAQIQRDMLDALWPLLKPGGRLLYCTCSVFRAEGEAQIDAFLQRHANAVALPAPGHCLPLPENGGEAAATAAAAVHDGFFYALLEKGGA